MTRIVCHVYKFFQPMCSMICVGKIKTRFTKPSELSVALNCTKKTTTKMIFSLAYFCLFAFDLFWKNLWFYLLLFTIGMMLIHICICLMNTLSLLAIVPIEYFSDRNGSGGNTNGSKIKSFNEENRVWSNTLSIFALLFLSFFLFILFTYTRT
jgi:hypothetical protein